MDVQNLIIVESPVKEKTIQRYLHQVIKERNLSEQYIVVGTGGHIMDIKDDDSEGITGITYENGQFSGNFKPLPKQKGRIKELRKRTLEATNVFLCTDDDREGERIADDIVEVCKLKKYFRVTFTEISKKAIERTIVDRVGIRAIDEKIVLAQWTRRMADRIVGYGLSPVIRYIFKKNKILQTVKNDGTIIEEKPSGTGRVIGISLSLLVQRQLKINEFKQNGGTPTDVVLGTYSYNGTSFTAKGVDLEYSKERSDLLQDTIAKANSKIHRVETYEPEQTDLPPYPPFITATIYSAISYIHGIPPSESKKILQELYESGYINYPRTDSFILSEETTEEIITYLFEASHEEEYPDILRERRKYKKSGAKNSQDAHEAIKPLVIKKSHAPENINDIWTRDDNCKNFTNNHLIVYELIWKRTIATQLKDSIYDTSTLIIKAGEYRFKVKSRERLYAGWEKYDGDLLHSSEKGREGEDWKKQPTILPRGLHVGLILEDSNVVFYEKIPKAPKRISEGALVARLNQLGVARPSTLHTISSALLKKKYVVSHKTLLTPTPLGEEVFKATETYASWVNDIDRAVQFEQIIHSIETGAYSDANNFLKIFWDAVEDVKKEVGFTVGGNQYEPPTENQVKYFLDIYEQMSEEDKNKINKSEIIKTKRSISIFLNSHDRKNNNEKKDGVLGICPKCESSSVVSHEKGCRCFKKECDFVIWNNTVESFFKNFQKETPDLIKFYKSFFNPSIDTKVNKLVRKSGTSFDSKVEPIYSATRDRWEVNLVKENYYIQEGESDA